MNELDVGVTEIWFNNIFDQTISTTAMAKQNNDEQHDERWADSKKKEYKRIIPFEVDGRGCSISWFTIVAIFFSSSS